MLAIMWFISRGGWAQPLVHISDRKRFRNKMLRQRQDGGPSGRIEFVIKIHRTEKIALGKMHRQQKTWCQSDGQIVQVLGAEVVRGSGLVDIGCQEGAFGAEQGNIAKESFYLCTVFRRPPSIAQVAD